MKHFAGITLAALILWLAACSPATPTPTPAPTAAPTVQVDAHSVLPCELLTAEDASALLGTQVKPTTMGSSTKLEESNFVMCAYMLPGAQLSGVSVTLFGRLEPASGVAMFQETQDKNKGLGTFTAVSGLGDDAFWDNKSVLMVKKGDVVFSVTTAGMPEDKSLGLAKDVAGKVLARLP